MKNVRNLKTRALSILMALTISGMPAVGNAEEINTKEDTKTYVLKTTSHDLVPASQEKKENPMTVTEYFNGVMEVAPKMNNYLKYEDADMKKMLMQEVECLYFLANYDSIPKEVEQELIDGVILNINGEDTLIKPIFETDMTRCADMSGIQNFIYANMLLNVVADFNQSRVRHTDNINDTIDLSMFCSNENDKKIIRKIHEHWFNSHKNGKYNEEEFGKACNIILTLNGEEGLYNADNLTVGARWMARLAYGNNLMQVIRDYLLETYSIKKLSKYFIKDELVRGQFFLRNDFELDFNCLSNLEKDVHTFGELWKFCLDDVNNDIFKAFEGRCMKLTK